MKGAIYPHVFFRKKSLQTPENCNMGGYHFTLLLFTSLVIFFFPTISISIDTLTSTNSVSNNQTLVSAGDVFELGFFNSGGSNSWYVGIWYKNIPTRTYVWIANRDSPLSNSSGVFKVVDQNIVLLDQNQNQVWSSNITKGNNSVAELLDSGNLVLRDAEDPNNYLWQSFDFPTDTLLPDMKLGWNLTSGLDRYLTSWRSLEDPSSGDFSFKLNYQGFPEIFMWIKQQIRYRSGPWNGQRFSGVPEMAPVDDLVFKFIADQDEVYYSFSVTNNILFYRLVLQSGGILARLTWIDEAKQWSQFWYAPEDQCDYYGKCGPYGVCDANESPVCQCPRGFTPKNLQAWNLRDGTNGCVRKTDLGCMSDKFLHLKNVKLPQSTTAFVDRSMSLDACENMCLRNCSCTAYANADISNGGSGCVIWFGELLDMRVYSSGGQDLFVRLNAADLGDSARRNALIIGITVGFAVLILGGIAFFIWKRKRLQRKGKLPELKGLPERSQEFLLNEMVISNRRSEYYGEKSGELELPLFDFDTIAIATDNFSIENKLGQGGFGCVYKGRLVEGRDIAVKRLSKNSGQGVEEFKNEVRLIARVQHRNLVRLVGCCVDMDEKMLIYEYMEHKSLDSILFNKNRSSLLNWQRRFNIICGIARGLLYLHYDSRFRIIHRDLKASNILLDAQMNPKISDFGMARIFGNDQNEANTKRVVGTYGYMSPEYAMDGLFSTKSDVFSFGVLVLEVVSGSKNRGFYQANSEQNLLGHAWRLWKEGKALELLDPVVGNSYPEQEVVRCIHVGLLCVQERAEDRPTMHSVILMLSSETAVMPRPKTPGFGLLERNDVEADSLSSKQDETFTVNQVTVTMLDAR